MAIDLNGKTGWRLRLSKPGVVIEGRLMGPSNAAVASLGPEVGAVRAWSIRDEDGTDHEIAAEDDWTVEEIDEKEANISEGHW